MTDSVSPLRRPVRIIHLGLGRFFRAHQAWYTAHATDAAEWGIAAFTIRSAGAAEELTALGYVYPLVVRGPASDSIESIDAVVAAHAGSDTDALRGYAARPEVAIITLTVTEAGYALDASGEPDLTNPELRADLTALRGGATTARTVLGRLALALEARRQANAGAIAIVPCDNIPANGEFVARGLTAFARALDTGLAEWMSANVSFVSTSVDRITPQTADGQLVTEPFTDWVLAGDFPVGRPAWESAGARFVVDIEPWENRKLWLLNGAHSILAFVGLARGLDTVADAIADPACRALVEEFWSEAVQALPATTEHENYRHELVERFENPRIVHRLSQIATDATTKVQFRFAAVAERTIDAGREPDASARAVASWISWALTGPPSTDARSSEVAVAIDSDDPAAALVALVSPQLAASSPFLDRVRDAIAHGATSVPRGSAAY